MDSIVGAEINYLPLRSQSIKNQWLVYNETSYYNSMNESGNYNHNGQLKLNIEVIW